MIDFLALAARVLSQSRSLLPAWFPEGRFRGNEFVVGNIAGDKGDSLSINWTTGRWSDFASPEFTGGDLISLYAAIHHIDQGAAARLLADEAPTTHAEKRVKDKRTIIIPVPDKAPICTCLHYKYGKAVKVWTYRDAAGRLLGHVARYEPKNEGERVELYGGRNKNVIPWTYARDSKGKTKWGAGSWDTPRPLYGLDDLAARVNERVLIVEGEKAADAARRIAGQYVVVTWPGGGKAWERVDWSPLKGRIILLWPDNVPPGSNDPGIDVMWPLGHSLLAICPTVRIVITDDPEKAEGWDAADALAEFEAAGVKGAAMWDQLKIWMLPRVKELLPNGGHDERENERSNQVAANGNSDAAGDVAAPSNGAGKDDAGDRGTAVAKPVEPIQASTAETASDAKQRREIFWYKWNLDTNGKGLPEASLNNAVTVIENDPAFKDYVWFDEFLQRIIANDNGVTREWREADDIRLALYMQRELRIGRMSPETVSKAVIEITDRPAYRKHSVRDWLNTIQWDGVPRIENFFEDNFGAPGSPYIRAVSKNFFLSLVARVFKPGCQVDNMVVLEGEEGWYKSQTLAALGGQWFSKQHESVANPKAFAEVLQGMWLVEIDEMSAFKRSGELGSVKAAVTTQNDRFRPAYGRGYAKDHPRQCVFVGTTNPPYDWNKSDSGARRFWPIRCNGEIDIENVRRYREQYFAEAVQRLLRVPLDADAAVRQADGSDWWQTPAVATKAEQWKRFEEDPWFGEIEGFLSLKTEVRVNEILTELLGWKLGDITSREQRRIASCLRLLGWENENVREGHVVRKVWRVPENGV